MLERIITVSLILLSLRLLSPISTSIDHNLCITPYLSSDDADCMNEIFGGDEEAIKRMHIFLELNLHANQCDSLAYLAEWTDKGSGLLAHKFVGYLACPRYLPTFSYMI